METTITATELSVGLSDILNRVKYKGERFIVRRKGETIATIAPASQPPGITLSDVIARIGNVKMPGEGFADDLEAVQAEQSLAEFPDRPQ